MANEPGKARRFVSMAAVARVCAVAGFIWLGHLMFYEPPVRIPLGVVKTVEHPKPVFSWAELRTHTRTKLCIDDQCFNVPGHFNVLPGQSVDILLFPRRDELCVSGTKNCAWVDTSTLAALLQEQAFNRRAKAGAPSDLPRNDQ